MKYRFLYVVILVVFLTLGFAAVNVSLSYKGSLSLAFNSDDFIVYLDNVVSDTSQITVSKDKKSFTSTLGAKVDFNLVNDSTQYDVLVQVKCNNSITDEFYIEAQKFISAAIETQDNDYCEIIETEVERTRVNNNLKLKNISINGKALDNFKDYIRTYSLDYEGTTVEVSSEAVDQNVSISGNGVYNLNWGTNEIVLETTNDLGENLTYKVIINNIRPVAPKLRSSSTSWAQSVDVNISEAGYALSGIKEYEYYYGEEGSNPDKAIGTGEFVKINVTGIYSVYFRSVSNNGFKSEWAEIKAYVDATSPTKPAISGGNSSWTYLNQTVSVSSNSYALSGIKNYQYYVSTSESSLKDGSWINISDGSINTSISTNGKRYVYLRAVSNSGLVSSPSNYVMTMIDSVTPTVSLSSTQQCSSSVSVQTGVITNDKLRFKLNQTSNNISGSTIYYCKDTTNTCNPTSKYNKNLISMATGTYYFRYKIVSGAGKSSSVYSYKAVVSDTRHCPINLVYNGSFEQKVEDWYNINSEENDFFAYCGSNISQRFGQCSLRIHSITNSQAFPRYDVYGTTAMAGHKVYTRVSSMREFGYSRPLFYSISTNGPDSWSTPQTAKTMYYPDDSARVWHDLALYYTSDYNYQKIMLAQAAQENVSGSVIHYDGLFSLDLTAVYGSGNEPTESWLNNNMDYSMTQNETEKFEVIY